MKKRFVSFVTVAVASAVLSWTANVAAQQTFPMRPIKMIVPYAPGGGVDAAGRILAQELSSHLPHPVVVENRGGAGGVLGSQAAATAAPDGHTLLLVSVIIATSQSMMKSPPFNTLQDLKAVSLIGSSPLVLTVHPSIPAKDMRSLVEFAKANPGKLNYASAGAGTTPHLAAELLRMETGIDITHVAYRGSGPAMTDLIAGTVQMAFSSIAAARPHMITGKLRGLATTGAKRAQTLPELPTVIETWPGVEVDLWIAMFAPAGTPDGIVSALNEAVNKALRADAVRKGFARTGQDATGSTPQEAHAFIKSEIEKWAKVVRAAKIESQ
jgi:tripartite-type tricarboxylate transporter receptor subunit TctC